MSDRFTDSNINGYALRHITTAIDSVDSDILSGSAQQSNGCIDGEWVLFTPPVAGEELSSISQQDMPDVLNTEDSHDVAVNGSDLLPGVELPTHNGAGAFSTPNASRRDLLERINAWRIEQSEYFFGETELNHTIPFHQTSGLHNEESVWQKLKQAAKQCIDWDEKTIDALFSKEFNTDDNAANEQVFKDRPYLQRARRYGPPGWEQHILNNSRKTHSTGLLMSLLTRILSWTSSNSQTTRIPKPTDSNYNQIGRRQEHDHSYHLNAIQNSIATITSATTATPWSTTWDTNTTTTNGVVA